jgi:hypothetical protein
LRVWSSRRRRRRRAHAAPPRAPATPPPACRWAGAVAHPLATIAPTLRQECIALGRQLEKTLGAGAAGGGRGRGGDARAEPTVRLTFDADGNPLAAPSGETGVEGGVRSARRRPPPASTPLRYQIYEVSNSGALRVRGEFPKDINAAGAARVRPSAEAARAKRDPLGGGDALGDAWRELFESYSSGEPTNGHAHSRARLALALPFLSLFLARALALAHTAWLADALARTARVFEPARPRPRANCFPPRRHARPLARPNFKCATCFRARR